MKEPSDPQSLLVTVHEPLSLDWNEDRLIIEKAAGQPTTADGYHNHAAAIQALFDTLTWDTSAQPQHPQRIGLLRDVHDELYPIAHFAKLYFTSPKNVVIQWIEVISSTMQQLNTRERDQISRIYVISKSLRFRVKKMLTNLKNFRGILALQLWSARQPKRSMIERLSS